MRRKEKRRKANIASLAYCLYKRTEMPYMLLFHAEDIAEETLCDIVYVNNVPIYSANNNNPTYIKNRRLLLRTIRRRTELKPHKIVFRGNKTLLK